jgi:hypothetical protein
MKQKYELHEQRLANEIAETLKDKEALPYYLTLTKKYHESFLRQTLAKVMSIDETQIRKTRGALFTYLINQKYGTNHSGA